MKETEVKLEDEGFEEVKSEPATAGSGQGPNKPDLNVVQADADKNGKVIYKTVGAMWKRVSKNGNDFYTLKIGELKLLVFPNDRK
jgi:uncharacterized protein (DUF736 family)